MHITGMTIDGIPPFSETLRFEFDERVNLFIGSNATGKSTLLRVISPQFPAFAIPGYDETCVGISASPDWPVRSDGSIDVNAVPQVYIPAARIGMPYSVTNSKVVVKMEDLTDWDDILSEAPFYLFDGERVYHATRKLAQGGGLLQESNVAVALEIAAHAFVCTQMICGDVLIGEAPEHYTATETLEHRVTDKIRALPPSLREIPILHYAMGATTVDHSEYPIYLGDLSSGTQGTYLWIWYLAFRMAYAYDFELGWERKPAVLHIDEIENHLHPEWQRRVIPALLDSFDGLQIFATTHSPFVVAGLETGQVHQLYRDEEEIVRAHLPNDAGIVGWTMDEILRGFMGVDDPTDDKTAGYAAELRALQQEGPRADEQAEEMRQKRISYLRKLVNRNMLEGGPFSAQTKVFAEHFSQILERHRSSRELNTENG